jgi:peptidoglycan/LPS O-acetylase OafA/YrhL
MWRHTWSLAVEEHFYILLPVIVLLLLRFSKPGKMPLYRYPGLALAAIALCLCLRVLTSATVTFWYNSHLFPTHLRIDTLLMGTLIAYGYVFYGERLDELAKKRWIAFVFGSLVFLALGIYWPLEDYMFAQTLGLTCLGVGYALLVAVTLSWETKFLGCRWTGPIGAIGRKSYCIYLWHLAVGDWVLTASNSLPSVPFSVWLMIYFGGSFALEPVINFL